MPGARRARIAAQVTGAIGGLLLLGAAAVPWSGRGAGSRLALWRVGDLILSGTVDAWVPRGAGLVVYAIPVGGALLLVGAGLEGRAGVALATTGVLGAVVGGLVVRGALDQLGRSGLGPGPVLAGAGAACGLVSVALAVRATRVAPPAPPGRGGTFRRRPPAASDGDLA